ncbi:MAG: hypothetical protein HXX11_19055 [Desulfuromonadales bacterium]|nr:hypothetical protein [Desulfuromonadales bacterium]
MNMIRSKVQLLIVGILISNAWTAFSAEREETQIVLPGNGYSLEQRELLNSGEQIGKGRYRAGGPTQAQTSGPGRQDSDLLQELEQELKGGKTGAAEYDSSMPREIQPRED